MTVPRGLYGPNRDGLGSDPSADPLAPAPIPPLPVTAVQLDNDRPEELIIARRRSDPTTWRV